MLTWVRKCYEKVVIIAKKSHPFTRVMWHYYKEWVQIFREQSGNVTICLCWSSGSQKVHLSSLWWVKRLWLMCFAHWTGSRHGNKCSTLTSERSTTNWHQSKINKWNNFILLINHGINAHRRRFQRAKIFLECRIGTLIPFRLQIGDN